MQNLKYMPMTPFKSFPQSRRVRQGCNSSPLLFSLYINDLESYFSCNPPGYCQLNSYKLHLLKFADDIVLLANSREGLQNSINRIEEFSDGWDLSINIEKLICNKPAHGSLW